MRGGPRSGPLARREKREKLLAALINKRRSCSFAAATATLRAWGFIPRRKEGNNSQSWQYEDITLAFHRPHNNRDMDPAAIDDIIMKIEQVQLRLRERP